MYHSRRRNPGRQPLGPVEIACIVVAIAAVVALVVWVIANAGGGALMT